MTDQQRLAKWLRRIGWSIGAATVPLIVADAWIHRRADFHPHFHFERWYGFFCGFGLCAALAWAGLSRCWYQLVRRPPDDNHA
jgi:hypothetical protein